MTGIMSQIQSMLINIILTLAGLHSPVRSTSDSKSRGHKFESQLIHITSMEIDPLAESRRAIVINWQKYVHKYWLTA